MDEKDIKSVDEVNDPKNPTNESTLLAQKLQLDTGEEYTRYRQRFWQIWYAWLVNV